MIKYTILPFLIALLFTGCVDRGHHIVVPTQQSTINTNNIDTKQINNFQNISSEVGNIEANNTTINNDIQNNIAGIFIIIIGIMIFL